MNTTKQNWSKYQSHNTLLARTVDPCELFQLYTATRIHLGWLAARWPNGSRSLYCEQEFLAGIKRRSLDLDPENDLGIREKKIKY